MRSIRRLTRSEAPTKSRSAEAATATLSKRAVSTIVPATLSAKGHLEGKFSFFHERKSLTFIMKGEGVAFIAIFSPS